MDPIIPVGTRRSHAIGALAIVATWVSAAVSVPYSKVVMGHGFTAEDILIVRSIACILVALIVSGGSAWRSGWHTILAGLIVGIASICFYRAIDVWEVAPVVVLLAFQPVVNLAIALAERKRPTWAVVIALAGLIAGTAVFLDPRHIRMSWPGLSWTVVSVILGGIGCELWSRGPKGSTVCQKSFWLGAPLIVIAFAVNRAAGHSFEPLRLVEPGIATPAMLFTAFVTLYIFAVIAPYSPIGQMDVVKATMLMMFATPFVVELSTRVNGERISGSQWLGALVVIGSAAAVARDAIRAEPQAKAVLVSQPSSTG